MKSLRSLKWSQSWLCLSCRKCAKTWSSTWPASTGPLQWTPMLLHTYSMYSTHLSCRDRREKEDKAPCRVLIGWAKPATKEQNAWTCKWCLEDSSFVCVSLGAEPMNKGASSLLLSAHYTPVEHACCVPTEYLLSVRRCICFRLIWRWNTSHVETVWFNHSTPKLTP